MGLKWSGQGLILFGLGVVNWCLRRWFFPPVGTGADNLQKFPRKSYKRISRELEENSGESFKDILWKTPRIIQSEL